MRQAQVLAYGVEGPVAGRLQELAQGRGLSLREVGNPRACLNLLRQGGPAVLVLKLGRNLVQELTLVQEVGSVFPEVSVVVFGDTDHPALAAFAWDLGAACVLFPPQPVELLPEVVLRLLPTEGP
jgi:DNA-binding NarL/FixJ family response regulator